MASRYKATLESHRSKSPSRKEMCGLLKYLRHSIIVDIMLHSWSTSLERQNGDSQSTSDGISVGPTSGPL